MHIAELIPKAASYLPAEVRLPGGKVSLETLLAAIKAIESTDLPGFVHDLARLEWAVRRIEREEPPEPARLEMGEVNPTLEVLAVAWCGLPELLAGATVSVDEGAQHVAVYKPYAELNYDRGVRVVELTGHELLAVKIVAEDLDKGEVAGIGGMPVVEVESIMAEARDRGMIHLPRSLIKRNPSIFSQEDEVCGAEGLYAEIFTLQWHLTQKCDLNCRHCYDRSGREEMSLEQAEDILDQFQTFCRHHRVTGQISFSGGNPLLYKHFDRVYQRAAEMGFMTAILGNPSPRKRLENILAIKRPEFFQVSLEGLKDHNDYIRGRGHFKKSIDFLELLRELGIYSMVMLTLTRHNVGEVLPLAEFLRHRTDRFNFNRLSPVGQGADLEMVEMGSYRHFLKGYMQAAETNPIMGLKDNLFNIIRDEEKLRLTGGCTGFGCGAAFNFVSLLPDGEVHACRKFPSYLGNIYSSNLNDIYHCQVAGKYRHGASGCDGCRVRRFCGGCLAVAQGCGGDPFRDRDPYCFKN